MNPAGPQTIITTWKADPATVALYAILFAVGAAYVTAAWRPSPRGRRWPALRTLAFLAGLALLAAVYGSGLEVYEDQPTVHVVQHMLTMMAVPPLLVLGAPIALLLRTLPSSLRPSVVRFLNDPAFAMLSGPRAPLLLCADYFLTMYVYQLTPLHAWSESSTELHALVHQYFLLCGLFFWWPIVALDPVRLRLSAAARRAMVAVGLPAFAALGGVELLAGHGATGWAYIACGAVLTAGGGVVVMARGRFGWRPARSNSAPSTPAAAGTSAAVFGTQ